MNAQTQNLPIYDVDGQIYATSGDPETDYKFLVENHPDKADKILAGIKSMSAQLSDEATWDKVPKDVVKGFLSSNFLTPVNNPTESGASFMDRLKGSFGNISGIEEYLKNKGMNPNTVTGEIVTGGKPFDPNNAEDYFNAFIKPVREAIGTSEPDLPIHQISFGPDGKMVVEETPSEQSRAFKRLLKDLPGDFADIPGNILPTLGNVLGGLFSAKEGPLALVTGPASAVAGGAVGEKARQKIGEALGTYKNVDDKFLTPELKNQIIMDSIFAGLSSLAAGGKAMAPKVIPIVKNAIGSTGAAAEEALVNTYARNIGLGSSKLPSEEIERLGQKFIEKKMPATMSGMKNFAKNEAKVAGQKINEEMAKIKNPISINEIYDDIMGRDYGKKVAAGQIKSLEDKVLNEVDQLAKKRGQQVGGQIVISPEDIKLEKGLQQKVAQDVFQNPNLKGTIKGKAAAEVSDSLKTILESKNPALGPANAEYGDLMELQKGLESMTKKNLRPQSFGDLWQSLVQRSGAPTVTRKVATSVYPLAKGAAEMGGNAIPKIQTPPNLTSDIQSVLALKNIMENIGIQKGNQNP